MMNPNEAQDRYRLGQLFLRQQIAQNTFPPATAVLVSFQPLQPLQPAQAGCSGTVPLFQLPHRHLKHQNPKKHPRLTIRGEQEEDMENGEKKRRSFLCSYGATSTED